MIKVKDLVELDPYIDRANLAEQTGIHYQTLSSKINRYKNGQNPTLSLEQSKAIEAHLATVHDLIHIILTT